MTKGRPACIASILLLGIVATASAAPQTALPGAPPRVLNVVHVRVKSNSSVAYDSLEAQIVRAYERAKVRMHWICLQSSKDSHDVLYLNLFDSREGPDRAASIYRQAVESHPELAHLQQRVAELTAATSSTLTTRREDIDRPATKVDFASLRTLRLTTFDVQPGREGEFVKAIRTANPKDGAWLVYEANDSSTFLLITLKRSAINRKDGPPIPRALHQFKNVYLKADSRIYSVRPAMSHVSQAFVTANPQLWRPPASALH